MDSRSPCPTIVQHEPVGGVVVEFEVGFPPCEHHADEQDIGFRDLASPHVMEQVMGHCIWECTLHV